MESCCPSARFQDCSSESQQLFQRHKMLLWLHCAPPPPDMAFGIAIHSPLPHFVRKSSHWCGIPPPVHQETRLWRERSKSCFSGVENGDHPSALFSLQGASRGSCGAPAKLSMGFRAGLRWGLSALSLNFPSSPQISPQEQECWLCAVGCVDAAVLCSPTPPFDSGVSRSTAHTHTHVCVLFPGLFFSFANPPFKNHLKFAFCPYFEGEGKATLNLA